MEVSLQQLRDCAALRGGGSLHRHVGGKLVRLHGMERYSQETADHLASFGITTHLSLSDPRQGKAEDRGLNVRR